MGEKYRLKHNVGKHYLPTNKGGAILAMKPGTIVDEEDIPSAAKDKFELASVKEERARVERIVINNLEAVNKGDGKWSVIHKKTKKPIHEGLLTKTEAEDLVGEKIEEKKKFSRKKVESK